MRKTLNIAMRFLIISSFIFGALLLLLKTMGLRINTTGSIPKGIYWVVKKPIEIGDYVIFCPPDTPDFHRAYEYAIINRGFCPSGYGSMMKRVAGMQGDKITINHNGVFVNGKRLPFSKPVLTDGFNNSLPEARLDNHTLESNKLLLMANKNPLSFDARYFGLIYLSDIEGVIKPVLTKPYFNIRE